ncbi:MAG: tRNA lysidine(34) synthetase TilS [Hoeflea sp.]|nr:tRNA lysidine(34) synthetase TilS [Hoeflea sp.]
MKPDHSGGTTHTPHSLLDCLSKFLAHLTDHRPLGVAVSGGSDSLGLLYGLAALMPAVKLVALSVDHGLRPGSADEARWVKTRCRRLGIRHETLRWEAGQPETGLQAAARAARYRLLAEASARLGLSAVLTAHTRDDQAETLVMRRARSASEDAPGLAGIPPATLFEGRMWVLRPLTGLPRMTIREFLRDKGVEDWIEDPSNNDPRFERVRVRSRLGDQGSAPGGSDGSQIAIARFRLACLAADFIDARCHVDADGLVRMRYRPNDGPEVTTAALEALIDWCGGASRPLDRRGKATLAGFVSSSAGGGEGGAISLGRTLIRNNGSCFALGRERRDVTGLSLEPDGRGVWDRRFRVHNLSRTSALTVSGGGNGGVMPVFSRDSRLSEADWGPEDGVVGGFVCQRLAGRSSHILPVQQLPVAQALARLAKLTPFPECPWANPLDIPALTAMKVR